MSPDNFIVFFCLFMVYLIFGIYVLFYYFLVYYSLYSVVIYTPRWELRWCSEGLFICTGKHGLID